MFERAEKMMNEMRKDMHRGMGDMSPG